MNPITVWMFLLLITDPNGTVTRQMIPFDMHEECHSAILEYGESLLKIDWDVDLHGKPEVACVEMEDA